MLNLCKRFSSRPDELLVFLLLVFSGLPAVGTCDALAELPAVWQIQLQALPEADLSGAEPYARKVIEKQREEVARLLEEGAAARAELAEAYGRLGALYQVYHLPSAAQLGYQNAISLAPDVFRWTYYAAYLASRNGRHAEAIDYYLQARELQPDYLALNLRLGESLLELNRLDEAAKALRTAAETPGLKAMALYLLAQIDLLQRRNTQAKARLQEVLSLDPQANRAHYPLARALRALGENEEARRQLGLQGKRLPQVDDSLIHELERLDQGAQRFFAEGLRASRREDFSAASQAFGQGLEIEPDNLNARVSYARALFLAGEPEQAGQQLETVLRQQPDHILALFLSAILLEEQDDADQATVRYRQVLQQIPDHYGAHYCLANRFYQVGDFTRAAEHYASALASQPEIPPARLYRLLAQKQSGEMDAEIHTRLDTLIAAHPEQLILRYLRIRLLVLSKDPQVRDLEQARQEVNALVQEAFIPPHVELQALVAASLGHFEQAAELQQQVLPGLSWLDPVVYREGEAVLAAYRRALLPEQVWYRDDRLLLPPKTDARLLFREYPSAVPY